jgi:hypothetical protein
MRRLLLATAMLLLALPCLAQHDHEVEVWWGRARLDFETGHVPESSHPAMGVAWRPPLGRGWRLEVALGGTRGLLLPAYRGSNEVDATWLQVGIVTPPATLGIASLRAFLRAGATALEQTQTDSETWPDLLRWTTKATVASAALGVRLDLALSHRLDLGLHAAWLRNAPSGQVDTPDLLTAGLGLTVRL